jgi:sporulation protein YhbH
MDRTNTYIKKIEKDHARFREIIRGQIRKDLRKYISNGEMIGRQGKYTVSIPLPQLRLPTFRYGSNEKSGVGQGPGDVGTPIAPGEPGPGGPGGGDAPGQHILEVELTVAELAQILGEELALPLIKPKDRSSILVDHDKYTGIARVGPESLRHFKRTYREALKRAVATGTYDPENPVIIPFKEDKRYRSWKVREMPQNAAVIIYMMDVSGSMGDEQKEIVRTEAFWIDTWLRSQYKKLETRYIIHDAAAKEVDRETFYHLKESGGTKISTAYQLCSELIRKDYNPAEWNIYPFHFSDGDNWSVDDTHTCVELLKKEVLPFVNLFCYGQVESPYGSGQFIKDLTEHFDEDERVVTSEIKGKDAIMDSIKEFLGKGK